MDLPCSSEGKETACNAGDPGSIPGQEDPLEKEMAIPSSILAWRIPWTEPPPGNVPKQAYWPHGAEREAILDRPVANQLPRCEQIWPRATKSIHRWPVSWPETPEWAWLSPAESPILPADPRTFKPLGCLFSMGHIMVDSWNISPHQFHLLHSSLWPDTVPSTLHV